MEEPRARFHRLHESGCFVMPNPWDIGSAVVLEQLGFSALATTSGGFAFSQGLPDSVMALDRDRVIRHIGDMVRATSLPVNADFQSGYADTPEGVGESVRLCAETGVAGLSIEDATGDPTRPLYELSEAVERLIAAREALDGTGVLLTARAECFLVGHPDPLPESIRRLQAYAEAGADVLFAPGPATRENVGSIVQAVHPLPVNVIVTSDYGLGVGDLAELGARRISVGSSLARAAWTAFLSAARKLKDEGSFEAFGNLVPYAELNSLFAPSK